MKKHFMGIVLLAAMTTTYAQGIKDLDFLIGTWQVEETILPGTDRTYTEEGTRICEYFLDGSYVKCVSKTVNSKNGRERTYAYVINYDKNEGCFWATALANDFPLQGQHKWFLDKENKRVHAITPRNVNNDRFFRGTISYADPDQLVWNGWASMWRKEKEWVQIFNDVATKTN